MNFFCESFVMKQFRYFPWQSNLAPSTMSQQTKKTSSEVCFDILAVLPSAAAYNNGVNIGNQMSPPGTKWCRTKPLFSCEISLASTLQPKIKSQPSPECIYWATSLQQVYLYAECRAKSLLFRAAPCHNKMQCYYCYAVVFCVAGSVKMQPGIKINIHTCAGKDESYK